MSIQKTAFVIMRAQPLHAGHIALINHAKTIANQVVVLLGSANCAPSVRNPWTYEQRRNHIQSLGMGVCIAPLNDHRYSDVQWRAEVRIAMDTYAAYGERVLVGHKKPGNDYLSWFPGVTFVDIPTVNGVGPNGMQCATDIREQMFADNSAAIAPAVMEDYRYFQDEQRRFAYYPYRETLNFNCADAVVECDGQIALIRRGGSPGKGCWALPGGFKNADEAFLDCAIRELREEVNIRVPEKVLRGSVVATRLFDDPGRGNGIPRNTLAVHIRVNRDPDGGLPRISPADDAMHCEWVPIYEAVNELAMFDDHQDIVCTMLATNPVPALFNPRYNATAN